MGFQENRLLRLVVLQPVEQSGPNSILPLDKTEDNINTAWSDIHDVWETLKNETKHPLHNLTQSDTARKDEILRIVHFNRIFPSKLSSEGNISKPKEYVLVQTPYKKELCDFLDLAIEDHDLQVVEYMDLEEDKPYYSYFIRNRECVENFYGKIIVINKKSHVGDIDALKYLFFHPHYSYLDYLRYGGDIVEKYGDELKSNSNSTLGNYKKIKRELLNKTDDNYFDYEERLRYLQSNRSVILEEKPEEIRKIETKLYLIEKYYADRHEGFISPHFHENLGVLLYKNETESHLEQLSTLINDIKESLRQIREVQQETTQF